MVIDGPGDNSFSGGNGDDVFVMGTVPGGNDNFTGGNNKPLVDFSTIGDAVVYSQRTAPVT